MSQSQKTPERLWYLISIWSSGLARKEKRMVDTTELHDCQVKQLLKMAESTWGRSTHLTFSQAQSDGWLDSFCRRQRKVDTCKHGNILHLI